MASIAEDKKNNEESFRTLMYSDVLLQFFKNPRRATYAWCLWVFTYWTLLAVIPGVVNRDLNSYQYYTWFVGMIGVCSMYYSTRADFAADSPAGKPIMALACLILSLDWAFHAWFALDGEVALTEGFIILGHSFSVLWASLFFYNRAITNGKRVAWLSLAMQWIDIVFCCIVIFILHAEEEGSCLNQAVCIGYFAVMVLNLILWFFPIMIGSADTQKGIHLHMVALDTCTDLPLVIIIVATDAYSIHWFIFIDIALKIIMIVRTYAYHLFINLILRRAEIDALHKQQTEQLELQKKLFDEGKSNAEIEAELREVEKKKAAENP